jgi:hypothetical protein
MDRTARRRVSRRRRRLLVGLVREGPLEDQGCRLATWTQSRALPTSAQSPTTSVDAGPRPTDEPGSRAAVAPPARYRDSRQRNVNRAERAECRDGEKQHRPCGCPRNGPLSGTPAYLTQLGFRRAPRPARLASSNPLGHPRSGATRANAGRRPRCRAVRARRRKARTRRVHAHSAPVGASTVGGKPDQSGRTRCRPQTPGACTAGPYATRAVLLSVAPASRPTATPAWQGARCDQGRQRQAKSTPQRAVMRSART